MMEDDFASGLTGGFNAMERLQNNMARNALSQQRIDVSKAREQDYAKNALNRTNLEQQRINISNNREHAYEGMLGNRAQLINQQIEMLKAKMAEMPDQLQILKDRVANQSLADQIKLHAQNLSAQRLLQNQQNMQNKYSLPYVGKTTDGKDGVYQRPTSTQLNKLQTIQTSFPQIVPAMQQIQKGAQYYMTAPKKLNKYIDSISAYMAGNATDAQVKLLSDAGISKDALTQAAEIAANTFQFPKTNDGMKHAFDLFTPSKGQSPESFLNAQNQLLKNMEERYWQAVYQTTKGMPMNDGSQIGTNSLDDMQSFIKKMQDKNYFGKISFDEDVDKDPGSNAQRENAIKLLMSKGMTREEAIKRLP